jgi:hypothetical protein
MVLGVAVGLGIVARRSLWVLYLAVPIVGALALDLAFSYFLAIRQMIYAIIPMTILFAFGVESLAQRYSKWSAALLAALLVGSLYADVNQFSRPRENWKAVATELQSEAARGACVVFIPANFEIYYTFFSPELSGAKCPSGPLPSARRVAVAVGPGSYPGEWSTLRDQGAPPLTATDNPPYVRVFSTR